MSKYIDAEPLYNQIIEKEELARQRVIDTPSRLPNGNANPYATRYATQLDERTTFKFMLTDAPASDVVEVVRCKDCKYCEHWYADKGRCFLWHEDGIDVFEDGFCNYAERRTQEFETPCRYERNGHFVCRDPLTDKVWTATKYVKVKETSDE